MPPNARIATRDRTSFDALIYERQDGDVADDTASG